MTKSKIADPFEIKIKMPYIHGLSVNHYKYSGGKYTKSEVKEWMKSLNTEVFLRVYLDPDIAFKPCVIAVSGEFKDKRSMPDLHNLTKIICDAVAPALGVNDRDIKTKTDIPKVVKRDYGIFFSKKVNLQSTGEIMIRITKG